MSGKIESGQLVTVVPLTEETRRELTTGDIVLCKVSGNEYLHLVKGVRRVGTEPVSFQIGNNRGGINGWTPSDKVYGKCVKVEP